MVLHLTSAAHHISSGRIIDTVAGASRDVHRLKNVNVGTFHLTVSHQEAGCCQRGQSAADNIALFSSTPSGFLGLAKAS